MINYDTILSTTEDKMTLLQWLKKVEAALKDASATSFNVAPVGTGVYKFVLTFADGTTLESDNITLGDLVIGGRITEESHLVLNLNNGEDLDLGSIFAADKLYIINKISDAAGRKRFDTEMAFEVTGNISNLFNSANYFKLICGKQHHIFA